MSPEELAALLDVADAHEELNPAFIETSSRGVFIKHDCATQETSITCSRGNVSRTQTIEGDEIAPLCEALGLLREQLR